MHFFFFLINKTVMKYNYIRLLYLPQSLSMRSRFFSSSSANFALDLTPSPDFWDFSTMPHALSTNDGTVSCFSCFGISTSVQYCVSNRITSYERVNNLIKKRCYILLMSLTDIGVYTKYRSDNTILNIFIVEIGWRWSKNSPEITKINVLNT